MKRLFLLAALASAPACYGSMSAFNAVHNWNGHASSSKVTNSLIHAALWIVPFYEIVIAGDVIIFNNIEFITGNPVFK